MSDARTTIPVRPGESLWFLPDGRVMRQPVLSYETDPKTGAFIARVSIEVYGRAAPDGGPAHEQDFAGAHVHDWRVNYWNGETGEQRESCRCRDTRTVQGRRLAART